MPDLKETIVLKSVKFTLPVPTHGSFAQRTVIMPDMFQLAHVEATLDDCKHTAEWVVDMVYLCDEERKETCPQEFFFYAIGAEVQPSENGNYPAFTECLSIGKDRWYMFSGETASDKRRARRHEEEQKALATLFGGAAVLPIQMHVPGCEHKHPGKDKHKGASVDDTQTNKGKGN